MDKDSLPSPENNPDASEQSLMGPLSEHLTREPLAHLYAPSKMFQVNLFVNPLVSAAAPLLSFTTQLAQSQHTPNFIALLQLLIDEIKAFEVKANQLGYRAQIILAARYLLCSLIDETILNTAWGKNSRWNQHNLLTHFQKENWGGKRFFLIVERAAEEPKIYIDLLELAYICLSLGYQGKYAQTRDYHGLALFTDKLYNVIRHERGESSRKLFITPPLKQKKKPAPRWLLPPLWFTGLITILILLGIFLPYFIHLQKLTKPMEQTIKNMQTASPQRSELENETIQ